MRRRIPLNPCDYMIFAHHRRALRRRYGGNVPFMMLDLDRHIEPQRVRSALVGAMLAHPAVIASLRASPFRLRPYWLLPRDPAEAVQRAADRAFSHFDLRAEPDWQSRLDALLAERYLPRWNTREGPQVRLEHYAIPDGRTRLCLRWPHFFMDAQGTQWFLAALGGEGPAYALPEHLLPDDARIDPLAETSFGRRIALVRTNRSARPAAPNDARQWPAQLTPLEDYRLIHRPWDNERFHAFQSAAKAVTTQGPALYARRLAACVIVALHRLQKEHGLRSPTFLTTFPLRVLSTERHEAWDAKRPMIGNYLATPIIRIPAELAHDSRAVGRELDRQLDDFRARQGALAQWTLLRWAACFHPWAYDLLFRLPLGLGDFSTGFSYYDATAQPLPAIAGANVTNLWTGGPTPIPPGLNPVFSRFGQRLNLALTYSRPAVSDQFAQRFVDLIEDQMFHPA